MHKSTALVIMAAGIGSRFGNGIKQLTPVGPNGEVIMDYSIKDAINAGFDKVIFITREELADTFKEIIGDRIAKIIPVEYAYQDLNDIPDGFEAKAEGRVKPWGTGHAVLSIRDIIDEPFAVINADDYYGTECFKMVHEFLVSDHDDEMEHYCMAGYKLKNTLSEIGGVSRGVCHTDEAGYLSDITETYEIFKTPDGAESRYNGNNVKLDPETIVSMNLWGLYPDFIKELQDKFVEFLEASDPDDKKCEFILPEVIEGMLEKKEADVKVLETSDRWFGVTYAEDKAKVVEQIAKLTEAGIY